MPLEGEYEPSPFEQAAEQVRLYESSGGAEGGELEGRPVVILTTKGRKSGKIRKSPLMRVEHDGKYAVIASMAGAPKHPVWYLNLVANPDVTLQDGPEVHELRAHTANAEERAEWWPRAVAAWPGYDEYQANTDREIPVVLFEPR